MPALTLACGVLLGATRAEAACTVPNQISNGQAADATAVMGNFNALGNCAVSTTSSPTSGGLAVFSGPTSVSTGNLTGDVTTAGGVETSLASTGVTPGSYASANITVDADGRITAASDGAVGSASAWTLAGAWTWIANVASVPIINLGSFKELLIIVRGVSASVSGVRRICASVDNGSTFFSASGDYKGLDSAGIEGNGTGWSHSSGSTAARSFYAHIINTRGAVKLGTQNANTPAILFVASMSDINAVRLDNSGGGNLTAGSMLVFGR